jgi:hydroxyethylthiazole kinase-like uncharacterized protein yjeF
MMSTSGKTQLIASQVKWPLHDVIESKKIEQLALSQTRPNELMQRAGLACAEVALAIAPHAQTIWIACGPGNNGGDGIETAIHLKQWGKSPIVTWLSNINECPKDTQHAFHRAQSAGVIFDTAPPKQYDLAIDALLGIGAHQAPKDVMRIWVEALTNSMAPVLCIDVPTGLNANTGEWLLTHLPRSSNRHTLSLLTLKPGLFTACGRDAAGTVWFNDLGISPNCDSAIALLQTSASHRDERRHDSHKGSYGDVCVLGGSEGMTGAAILAGVAANNAGAGRVFIGLIDDSVRPAVSGQHPSLMFRQVADLSIQTATVVCGCGGGSEIKNYLAKVISESHQLILDADALNAISVDASLKTLLTRRAARNRETVITPHPLEAARLLQCSTLEIQNNRLHAAQKLAKEFQTTVVLKGSGTVIAHPAETPVVNLSGNPLLASAGTGDVLAGLIGGYMAQSTSTFKATYEAVYWHGHIADTWPSIGSSFNAAQLANSVR